MKSSLARLAALVAIAAGGTGVATVSAEDGTHGSRDMGTETGMIIAPANGMSDVDRKAADDGANAAKKPQEKAGEKAPGQPGMAPDSSGGRPNVEPGTRKPRVFPHHAREKVSLDVPMPWATANATQAYVDPLEAFD